MLRRCRYAVAIVMLVAATACGGRPGTRAAPDDPFATTPESGLPMGSLAGQSALLLPAGGLVVGDSGNALPAIVARRAALLDYANAVVDTAVRRDAREVRWFGLTEQRRVARGAPTLSLDPDHFSTAHLVDRRVGYVADPLRAQLRTLAGLTNARLALAPTVVRVSHRGGGGGCGGGGGREGLIAEILWAAVDARLGSVVARGRASGLPAPTAEAAIANAAARLVAR